MNNKNRKQAIGAFFLTFAICLVVIIPAVANRITTDRVRIEQLIDQKSVKISEAISLPINQIYTVASYIERKNGDLSNLDEVAATIVNNHHIRNLIIAPDGVVTQVYPATEDNLSVIGLDYFSDSSQGNREAVIAAQTHQILLAGPFTTVVGDQAMSGRIPIFVKNEHGEQEFWGLVSITLRYPEVLENTNVDALNEQGVTYELWRDNVDTKERQVIMTNGEIDTGKGYLDKPIQMINAKWNLRMSPIEKWYQYHETWGYLFVSLLISGMVAVLIQKNGDLKQAKETLEVVAHYDPLTNILNRQGLFLELNKLIEQNKKFVVYYVDLNYFKQINDTYGHATGDFVLAEFARRISQHIDEKHIFARMGGDEFVIAALTNSLPDEDMDVFWDTIYEEFEEPVLRLDNDEIILSFSKGDATFLVDADNLDSVISSADEQMYIEKKKRKRL